MKFSLAVSTARGFEDIEPLFRVSSPDAEIIIIDSKYNEKTKQELLQLKHDYCKVTYAPPREAEKKLDDMSVYAYRNDKNQGRNTGLAYCEGEWIYRLDDCVEFCPDFFKVIGNAIDFMQKQLGNNNFVIRPVKLEEWNGHIKWDDYPILKDRKERFFQLERHGFGGTGYFETLDQFIATRESIDLLNGMEELFDVGHGHDDRDIFQRFLTLGYKVFLDKDLKTFQYGHKRSIDPIPFTQWVYDVLILGVLNGRYRAYNTFDLKELRKKLLKEKDNYAITKKETFYNDGVSGRVRPWGQGASGAYVVKETSKEEEASLLDKVDIPHVLKDGVFGFESGHHMSWDKIKPAIVDSGLHVIVDKEISIDSPPVPNPKYFNGEYPFDKFFSPESLHRNRESIKTLRDIHKGQDLFILGNSPDITKEFIDKIRNKITFAANGFAVARDAWDFEPTYMVVSNQGTFDNHLRNMRPEFTIDGQSVEGGSVAEIFFKMKATKFIFSDRVMKPVLLNLQCMRPNERISFLDKSIHVRVLNRSEFESPYEIDLNPPALEDISFDLEKGTYLCGTVITDLMIPLAVWMGFKNIYLKGCSGGAGHFYDTAPRHFWDAEKQKKVYGDLYALFKQKLDMAGVGIYNLDKLSPADTIAESESRLKENPTTKDGHHWNGPLYATLHALGKYPNQIGYKSIDEVL